MLLSSHLHLFTTNVFQSQKFSLIHSRQYLMTIASDNYIQLKKQKDKWKKQKAQSLTSRGDPIICTLGKNENGCKLMTQNWFLGQVKKECGGYRWPEPIYKFFEKMV